MTSYWRRCDVTTSHRRHFDVMCPLGFLINQCQIITILILKSDIIENSRIELREIVLPVPSNQIKVTFIIILPFNLVHLWFFPVSHRNWRKRRVDYWGGGGAKGYVGPPPKLFGGGGLPPCPPPPPPPPPLPPPLPTPMIRQVTVHGILLRQVIAELSYKQMVGHQIEKSQV